MVTIQDIADKLGISKGTVSKAINGAPDISETLQKQILETAVEMGYTKLRRPEGKQPEKLCILVPRATTSSIHSPIILPMISSWDFARWRSLPASLWRQSR